ncbi:hypothetical protein EYV94_21480 [Puteibacter caeruleilacunae]|nr:hypothetical protein EYV94_21480 [Puteibacter caeruleilacunae]
MNKLTNSCLLCIILLLGIKVCLSQEPKVQDPVPSIGKPSVDANALGLYGRYPVNMANGLVNVSIPICNLKTRNFNLDISVSYHSSGIHVAQEAGSVGLGWSLNAGGVITRNMRGKPDEDYSYGFMRDGHRIPDISDLERPLTESQGLSFFDKKEQYINNDIDNAPDIFSYNFMGNSGKFIFGGNGSDDIIMLPHSNMKINIEGNLDGFIVTDERGNKFYFNKKEETYLDNGSEEIRYVSSWYLGKIVSSDTCEEIIFEYVTGTEINESVSYSSEYHIEPLGSTCKNTYKYPMHTDYHHQRSATTCNISCLYLNKIICEKGTITFEGDRIRKDRPYGLGYKYNKVSVNNICGDFVKEVELRYRDFDQPNTSMTNRMMLSSIVENDELGAQMKITKLFYYGDSDVDLKLPSKDAFSVDYWGYYNGKNNVNRIIPPFDQYNINGANRNVDSFYCRAGSLKQIVYPTGGYTSFIYESNRGLYRCNRIISAEQKSIDYIAYASDNNENVDKVFLVQPNEDGTPVRGEIRVELCPYANDEDADFSEWCDLVAEASIIGLNNVLVSSPIQELNEIFDRLKEGINPDEDWDLWSESGLSVVIPVEFNGGETITLRAQSFDCYDYSSENYVRLTCRYWNKLNSVDEDETNILAGGLRIKCIENHDSTGQLISSKDFKYTQPNSEITSGRVINLPLFGYLTDHIYWNKVCAIEKCSHLNAFSNSMLPIYNMGSSITYTNVTEFDGTEQINNGWTTYDYSFYYDEPNLTDFTNVDVVTFAQARFPFAPYTSKELYCGKLLNKSVYRNTGGSPCLVREEINSYDFGNEIDFRRVKGIKYMYNTNPTRLENCPECMKIDESPCDDLTHWITRNDYITGANFYTEYRWINLQSKLIKEYFGEGKIIETETKFVSENKVHKLITEDRRFNSAGKEIKTRYLYSSDFIGVGWIEDLKNNNIKTVPIRIEKVVDQTVVGGQAYKYDSNGKVIEEYRLVGNYPEHVKTENAIPDSYQLKNSYSYHPVTGNIIQVSRYNGITESYIWAYENTQPILKIIGKDYNSLEQKYGYRLELVGGSKDQDVISEFVNEVMSESGSGSQGVTYIPLIGTSKIMDANGVKTIFEYDNGARLKFIKNDDGKVRQEYKYNYGL